MAVATFARSERPKRIEVYVVRDAHGVVIYVGRTDSWWRRKSAHRASKWLPFAEHIEHRYFDTYGDSLVAEAILIRDHQPRFNVEGVTR